MRQETKPNIQTAHQTVNIKMGGMGMMGSFHAAVADKATVCKNENGRQDTSSVAEQSLDF